MCSAKSLSPERIGARFVRLLAWLNIAYIAYIARSCDIPVLLDAVAAAATQIRSDNAPSP